MKIRDHKARDARINTARINTGHVENVSIVKGAHQSRTGAESAPQRFKRLVRDMNTARMAREVRGHTAPTGTLSLWKRELG